MRWARFESGRRNLRSNEKQSWAQFRLMPKASLAFIGFFKFSSWKTTRRLVWYANSDQVRKMMDNYWGFWESEGKIFVFWICWSEKEFFFNTHRRSVRSFYFRGLLCADPLAVSPPGAPSVARLSNGWSRLCTKLGPSSRYLKSEK